MQYFTLLKAFPYGGRIYIMDGYAPKSDHIDLLIIAFFFAQQGHTVQIPTEVHYKDEKYKHIFGKLIGTIYERRCPDLIIDGVFYEYENFVPPFKKEKISNMISKGLKQSSRIIINNNNAGTDLQITRNIHNRVVYENQKIDEVWLYEKGNVRLAYKMKQGA